MNAAGWNSIIAYSESSWNISFLCDDLVVNPRIEEKLASDTRLLLHIVCVGQCDGLGIAIQDSISHQGSVFILELNS